MVAQSLSAVAVVAAIAVLEALSTTRFYIPNAGPILLLGVILGSYVGGIKLGLATCAVTSVYYLGYDPLDGRLFNYTEENLRRAVVFAIVSPAAAVIIGYLKMIQEQLIERKRQLETMAEELERKNAELLELSQVQSTFVSSISHELKTPLTIITSATNNFLDEAFGTVSETQKKWLQKIKQNSHVLQDMINKMLEVSRLKAGKMDFHYESVDIGEVMESLSANLQMVAREKSIDLSCTVAVPLPKIWLDQLSVERVLANLITNAIKFTPSGGAVRVSAARSGESIEVKVSDTGPGIPPEHREIIFEPFKQVHENGGKREAAGGVGLGLAICKEIVTQHQGRIWVEGEYGKGSDFIFSLPIRVQKGSPVA